MARPMGAMRDTDREDALERDFGCPVLLLPARSTDGIKQTCKELCIRLRRARLFIAIENLR